MDSKFFIALGVLITIFCTAVAIFANPLYIIFAAAGAYFTRLMVVEHKANR